MPSRAFNNSQVVNETVKFTAQTLTSTEQAHVRTNTNTGVNLQTTVATTSGTAIDFTSIPSGVKRITVGFKGVSVSGTSNPLIQIGGSSIEASGYLGAATSMDTALATSLYTTGFGVKSDNSANLLNGSFILSLISVSANSWAIFGSVARDVSAQMYVTSGSKALSGTLAKLRITTVGGSDTFTAGSLTISWEF